MRLTKTLSVLALAGSLVATAHAAPEHYELDETHTFVNFSVSHLGVSYIEGRFNELSGSFVYDSERPQDNSVSMEVNPASIDTNHAERDRHLRSNDYLSVGRHAVASFKSTGFEPKGEDGVLSGELTFFGNTRPITVDVEFVGAGEDPWGGYRRGYVGTTTIRPSEWGMKYNLGPAAETVELRFVLEGVRK